MTLVGYALHQLVPAFSERWLLGAMGFFALLGYALAGLPPLLRLLVPASVRAARVDAHAKRVFVEEGVMETRARSGVLIYIAEAEHRVEILADAGIHARVEAGFWDAEVRAIVERVRKGEAAEGLLASVGRIGEALAEQFPRTGPRENQLDDELRER